MIYIYNTLTKQKEPLKPIDPPNISLYVCGLTVYDECHIGHARIFIWFDVLVRYLRSVGYKVTYVRNITDIDDKIIKRANELGISYQDLTSQVIRSMHEDEKRLKTLPPDFEPKVTDHILEIINMIETLVDKKYAYTTPSGDLYFSVEKFQDYGKLAHQNIEDLCAGARVEKNEEKHNPLDFVLWKAAKPAEPSWPSPWGQGRPGWHIECSAMAKKHLGATFDIHGGGSDLQFPHHQNEAAQSEAANSSKMANYWMHVGFIQVDKEKMSKSKGNFFTLKEVLDKYHPEVLRYFIISSHYRSPINHSGENLENAEAALRRFYIALRSIPPLEDYKIDTDNHLYKEFDKAMADDFNTPQALSVLFDLVREINQLRDHKKINDAKRLSSLLKKLGNNLGLFNVDPDKFLKIGADHKQIETLIVKRNLARDAKNWEAADKIRDQLAAMGVVLEDSPTGTNWILEDKERYLKYNQ